MRLLINSWPGTPKKPNLLNVNVFLVDRPTLRFPALQFLPRILARIPEQPITLLLQRDREACKLCACLRPRAFEGFPG